MYLLYLVPKNWLSRAVGRAVRRRWPLGLHGRIRDTFIRHFKVDTAEAEHPLSEYPTLGEFFVRRLRSSARPVAAATLISPVDGVLTQRGPLLAPDLRLTQIKGIHYSLSDFLDGRESAAYAGGAFLTVYLAPHNYHRIHAPADVKVTGARHVPGALWPVNAWSVRRIRGLFVRNDRVIVEMRGADPLGGRMAMVLVGATNVGRITLSFSDLLGNDASASKPRDWKPSAEILLRKGAELGCFEMGSTIVLILDAAWAARLKPGLLDSPDPLPLTLRMGEELSG